MDLKNMFNNLLRDIQRKFSQRASVRNLLQATSQGYFERARDLTRPRYIGYRFDFEDSPIHNSVSNWIRKVIGKSVKVTYVSLYFSQRSASSGKNYLFVFRIPYRLDADKQRLLDLPVQYYCECDAFKYFIAYALHKTNNIFLTDIIRKRLGIALTEPPKIRNPKEIKFFCKHAINILSDIQGRRLSYFLSTNYKIREK